MKIRPPSPEKMQGSRNSQFMMGSFGSTLLYRSWKRLSSRWRIARGGSITFSKWFHQYDFWWWFVEMKILLEISLCSEATFSLFALISKRSLGLKTMPTITQRWILRKILTYHGYGKKLFCRTAFPLDGSDENKSDSDDHIERKTNKQRTVVDIIGLFLLLLSKNNEENFFKKIKSRIMKLSSCG